MNTTRSLPRATSLEQTGTTWGRRFLALWGEVRWYVIAALWLVALALGCLGFDGYFAARGEARTPLDILYLSLQLFTLESGSVGGPLPLSLEVARLLAPAVAGYTVLAALAGLFSEQLQSLRMRFLRDHVVICGLGRRGSLLAREFRARGLRVVGIDKNQGSSILQQYREQGIFVLFGNVTDPQLLRKARVDKARYLFCVTGDDGDNAEAAVLARELVRGRRGKALTCIAHIVHPQLCSLLREQEIGREHVDSFRLGFFNVFDTGAQALLTQYPPFTVSNVVNTAEPGNESAPVPRPHPHLLVVGAGRLGESLVVHAARNWREARGASTEKLSVTVIDRNATQKTAYMYEKYPDLEKLCEITACQMEVQSLAFRKADFLYNDQGRCHITSAYICLDNDSLALSTALTLFQKTRHEDITVIVRTAQDAGLAALFPEDGGGSASGGPRAFGLLDRTCKPELLLSGTHEILARAIHEDYVRRERESGQTPETNPSMVPWDKLPESLKESNRLQAGHIRLKLEAVGCGLEPLIDWDAELFSFDPGEIELMAEMEHARWYAERVAEGWTYAPPPKDERRKTSPYLVPWKDLQENIREFDRATVRGLPAFLARIGLKIYRIK